MNAIAPTPFIVGVGRSGTTLLRLMLDAHPQLAIPGETHFIPALIKTAKQTGSKQETLDVLTESGTWPNLGLTREAVADAFAVADPFNSASAVRTVMNLYASRFDKPRWGDKTPTYRRALTVIGAALPEARFIHIIRDGRDVALSYRGLWFGPGDELEAQARFWTAEISEARRQGAPLSNYMELRFEDLVRDPERELRRICIFLELSFEPAMLTYNRRAAARLSEYVQTFGPGGVGYISLDRFIGIHERTTAPPDVSRIGRWRTDMTLVERGRYEAIAAPLLSALGYPLDNSASL